MIRIASTNLYFYRLVYFCSKTKIFKRKLFIMYVGICIEHVHIYKFCKYGKIKKGYARCLKVFSKRNYSSLFCETASFYQRLKDFAAYIHIPLWSVVESISVLLRYIGWYFNNIDLVQTWIILRTFDHVCEN